MRISVKCSTAVHMLLMIAVPPAGGKVTGDYMAGSIGCNPVEIRKLLSALKRAGLIDVARGTGGATLLHAPGDITLYDIFSAVDHASLDELIGVHTHPTAACPFGRNIQQILSEPYAEIGNAIRTEMQQIKLSQLLDRLATLEPDLA